MHSPAEVVRRAAAAGLSAIALTDHDTVGGLGDALRAAEQVGLRVITGCEFSVAAKWGEMHLLGYFLPLDAAALNAFLEEQRDLRHARAVEIVARLNRAGVRIAVDEVLNQAEGGAIGRPHVARVLIARGIVADVSTAFAKYLGRRRPGFVPKQLPTVARVVSLVHDVGGLTVAAHLKGRAGRAVLRELRESGLDGVEVVHPAHDELTAGVILALARELDLVPTGGSDWHGVDGGSEERAPLGTSTIPVAWLDQMERVWRERVAGVGKRVPTGPS